MINHDEIITSGNNAEPQTPIINLTTFSSSVNQLKLNVENELLRIGNHKYAIDQTQSNLALLLKRYHTEKSYFAQVAEWYGGRSWWIKGLIGVAIAALGAGLGLLFHAPFIMAVAITGFYFLVGFIFINHYNISEKQTTRLCQDIIELEISLGETIRHYNELGESLQKIFEALYRMSSDWTENIDQLETNTLVLQTELIKYREIIATIASAEKKIELGTASLVSSMSRIEGDITDCQQTLLQQSEHFVQIEKDISATSSGMLESGNALSLMQSQYHHETTRIAATASAMENIVVDIKGKNNHSPSTETNTDVLDASVKLITEANKQIETSRNMLNKFFGSNPSTSPEKLSDRVALAMQKSLSVQERAQASLNPHVMKSLS